MARTNNTLVQAFTSDAADRLLSVTRSGSLTVMGSVTGAVATLGVNGRGAVLYSDGTFATTNGLGLEDGHNLFVTAGSNAAGALVVSTINKTYLPASVSLAYDLNGNLTNDGLRNFTYNDADELASVSVTLQWKTEFMYDALGRRRIAKDYAWQGGGWSQTNETRYVYDGMTILQERDSANTVKVTYTRGLDLSGTFGGAGGIGGLLARTDANGSVFYQSDGGGNITALTDSGGNVVGRYLYDPFGTVLGKWGAIADANVMQFSSMPRHANSALSLYAFREYDPTLQRWTQRDPIGERGGMNLYRFAGNSPLVFVDPLGLEAGYLYNTDGSMTLPNEDAYGRGSAQFWSDLLYVWNKYVDPPPPEYDYIDAQGRHQKFVLLGGAPPFGPEEFERFAVALRNVPGTYKVCLSNGKVYVGKAIDLGKRLAQHVKSGKWKWSDIKKILAEITETENMRRIRETERLMEETGGAHPSQSPNVLNERMPPKPKP